LSPGAASYLPFFPPNVILHLASRSSFRTPPTHSSHTPSLPPSPHTPTPPPPSSPCFFLPILSPAFCPPSAGSDLRSNAIPPVHFQSASPCRRAPFFCPGPEVSSRCQNAPLSSFPFSTGPDKPDQHSSVHTHRLQPPGTVFRLAHSVFTYPHSFLASPPLLAAPLFFFFLVPPSPTIPPLTNTNSYGYPTKSSPHLFTFTIRFFSSFPNS